VWISAVGRTSFSMSHEISVDGDVRVRGVVRRVARRPSIPGPVS